ncbi:hypothetical protein BD309DRAFT_1024287 [Dichomitus squalens]|uniref:Uncharacterized protein n=1 Tax=Dichomitus squalens TaxID=114155 RepID=A0A4Q9N8K7_9APHY|nr:hypothetical protein BD309DRAFT_1024287 [Dichomitus squalens]TBU56782.1 hypothetical protein BD310DRAFT_978620 [Dichomitus squalens]
MNKCPNEILGLIFAQACTDDGLTGRSLSLVSEVIRSASRRYALQSIALYGSYQLSAFASLLDTAVDAEDRRVCHLYLTDRRHVWMEYLPEGFHVNDPSQEHSTDVILRILKAATLQTLALLLFDRYDQPPLTDAIRLPNLEELAVHSSSLYSHLTQPQLPECLSLRRLHVIQDFTWPTPSTEAVSRLSPLLTHLRLSRIRVSRKNTLRDIVQGLERMLQQDDLASTGFPPTLKRVLVQMQHPFQYYSTTVANELLVLSFGQQLNNIMMRDVRRRIVVLKPATLEPIEPSTTHNESNVVFYMGIRAAWERRGADLDAAVWDIDPSSILHRCMGMMRALYLILRLAFLIVHVIADPDIRLYF